MASTGERDRRKVIAWNGRGGGILTPDPLFPNSGRADCDDQDAATARDECVPSHRESNRAEISLNPGESRWQAFAEKSDFGRVGESSTPICPCSRLPGLPERRGLGPYPARCVRLPCLQFVCSLLLAAKVA